MKKLFLLSLFLLISLQYLNAQFSDDLESYIAGEPICSSNSNDVWQAWCTPLGEGCCMMATSDQSRTGIISGEIPGDGTTSALLNLGNFVFGRWVLQFHMYIPSSKEASFNIQEQIPPIGSGHSIVGDINFNKDITNPGVGYIDWNTTNTTDDTYFNFPHNEWFHIIIYIDFSLGASMATWYFSINSTVIVPTSTPFANGNGIYPTSLGGINFPSVGADNLYYLDDFCYEDVFSGSASDCFPLSTNEIGFEEFSIYPNPVIDFLHVKTIDKQNIKTVKIFNPVGKLILVSEQENSIDFTKFSNGLYHVFIETDTGYIANKKVIKI